MDDVITGADNLSEAFHLQQELCALLKAGGFCLRKWSSNCVDLLQSIPKEMKEFSNAVSLSDADFINTLGLQWNPVGDYFSFVVSFPIPDKTMRQP